jgi:glycosyltransferase involved in cell wall biosynthesis
MNQPPSFSVVMPLYNKAPHVEAAVRSALDQSRPAAEVIVVDDGSTDGSLQIVRGIEDDRLRILERSPPGPGGYAARNLGIKSAKGDWIAFLDADDRWTEVHLEDLASAITACPTPVGCAFTRFEIVNKDGRRAYTHSDRLIPHQVLPLTVVLEAWLDAKRCPVWTGAAVFRTRLLLDAGLFPEQGVARGGDKDMWLRALARADAVFVDRSSAEFHQDTVNRVTRSAHHSTLPAVVRTISALIEPSTAEQRALLKRLSNMETVLYARHSAGRGEAFGADFFRALYPPLLGDALKLCGYRLASLAMRFAGRRTAP